MPQKDYLANKKDLPAMDTSDEASSDENQIISGIPLGKKTVKFSLYVRGPNWIKDRDNATSKLLAMNPKIKNVRHPRQKSADYCFVDFASAIDRDQSYEEFKKNPEITVKTVTEDNPKLLEKRKKKVSERREAKKQAKQALAKINSQSDKSDTELSNQILIVNFPKEITTLELKQQYENVIKINMKLVENKNKFQTAILSFATPFEAKSASKKTVIINGTKLKTRLNTTRWSKRLQKSQKRLYKERALQKQQTTESVGAAE